MGLDEILEEINKVVENLNYKNSIKFIEELVQRFMNFKYVKCTLKSKYKELNMKNILKII